MPKELRISACVIVKNEERDIESWLENAKTYADELIVVDTGSTDNTREIARQSGAQVFSFPWQDDFAQAKNYAMEKANGDWLTFLDADETFYKPELVRDYLQQLTESNIQVNVLMVPIINVDEDEQDREQSRFLNVRLFRHHFGFRYQNPVHESLYAAGNQELQIYEIHDALHIRHTGYSTRRVQAKVMRNYRILLADIEAHGEQEHHYRYLADCYYGLGKLEQALHYALLAARAQIQARGSASDMYDTAIACMELLSYPLPSVMSLLAEASQRFPHKLAYPIKMGHCYVQQEQWAEAQQMLSAVRQEISKDRNGNGDEYTTPEEIALFWQDLGRLYYHQGDTENALDCLTEARKSMPLHEDRFSLLMKLIQNKPLQEQCSLLLENTAQSEEQRNYLLQWLEINGYLQHYARIAGKANETYDMARREELMELYKEMEEKLINNLSELCRVLIGLEAQPDSLNRTKQIIALQKLLPAPLLKIWICWERKGKIEPDQYDDFKLLSDYVLKWGTDEQLEDYLQLAGNVLPEQILALADDLQQQGKFTLAWQFYSIIPADSPAAAFDFWFHAGTCQYALGGYETAAECFVRAEQYDGDSGELQAYKKWNERRWRPNG